MKSKIALSIAALMGASLMAAPATAQVSVGGGVGADIGVNAGEADGGDAGGVAPGADVDLRTEGQAGADTELDTGTTAAIGGSFDGALSAMDNNAASASSISSMTDVGSVNVIRISELEGADMDAIATAESENNASIDELRSSIEGNAAVSAALEAQAVEPSTVVAADVAADGSLTVYVR